MVILLSRVLIDKANELEKPMLENVTLLYASGSADGKTDSFSFCSRFIKCLGRDSLLHHLSQPK